MRGNRGEVVARIWFCVLLLPLEVLPLGVVPSRLLVDISDYEVCWMTSQFSTFCFYLILSFEDITSSVGAFLLVSFICENISSTPWMLLFFTNFAYRRD